MSPWANLVEKTEPEEHVVQLYGSDDELLVKNVGRYLAEGLDHGEGLLVIATSKHGDALASALARDGVDLAAVTRRGQLVWRDAERTLPTFMVDGEPDEERFTATIGGLLGEVRPLAGHRGIRAFGEMVGLLWAAGQRSASFASKAAGTACCGSTPSDSSAPIRSTCSALTSRCTPSMASSVPTPTCCLPTAACRAR